VLVRRTIGGVFKRYIERLERREIVTFDADAFFVDAGSPTAACRSASISGLGHLEGQVVAVVGDGVVIFNGDPTGAECRRRIHRHRRHDPGALGDLQQHSRGPADPVRDLETLDLDVQGAAVRDKKKRVGSVDAAARCEHAHVLGGAVVDAARPGEARSRTSRAHRRAVHRAGDDVRSKPSGATTGGCSSGRSIRCRSRSSAFCRMWIWEGNDATVPL
jgi:hypothetical protein